MSFALSSPLAASDRTRARAASVRAALRRRPTLTLVTVAVLLAAQPASGQTEKPSLLLMPIVVHSSENPGYLRDGLSDMLATRFIQEGNFEIMHVDDSRRATTRLSDALDAAREENADYVLFGSFTRFGEGASLDMQAAATAEGEEGETLREIFVHSGSIGEVIPDLTDLVGKVTRFAIPTYIPLPAARGDAPGTAAPTSRDEINDLRRRIAALEQAIRALEQSSDGDGQ